KVKVPQPEKASGNETIIEATGPTVITPLRKNALKVDFLDLKVEEEQYNNIYFSNASDIVFNKHGLQENPWNHSVQFKSQIVDRDSFSSGGFEVKYTFEVKGKVTDNEMQICVERPEIFKVKVNGTPVKPIPGKWFLDKEFPLYDISKLVKQGENLVELQVKPMRVFAETEPIYVVGNFSVLPKDTGWYIDMNEPVPVLGSWKEQGLPFYSWEVGYRTSYQISDVNRAYKITIPEWNGTVAEVIVNGQPAGIIGMKPYELFITKYIQAGINDIEL